MIKKGKKKIKKKVEGKSLATRYYVALLANLLAVFPVNLVPIFEAVFDKMSKNPVPTSPSDFMFE